MAVRDPRNYEDKTPGPEGDAERQGGHNPEGVSPVEKLKRSYWDAEELKMFKQVAGIDDHKPVNDKKSGGSDESPITQIMVASMKAQSDAINTILTHLATISARPDGQNNQLIQFMQQEITELKSRREESSIDPLELMTETATKFEALGLALKKHLGLPDSSNVNTSDIPGMLQLEELKIDREERQRQHESDIEERRHRWDKEDKQFMMWYEVEKTKIQNDLSRKTSWADDLKDGIKATINAIDRQNEEGVGKGVKEQRRERRQMPEEKPEDRIPTSFKCEGCGEMVNNPDKSLNVTCPACGAEYDMTPGP